MLYAVAPLDREVVEVEGMPILDDRACPRWCRSVLVQSGRPGAHALARRAARRAASASQYMRTSRIQKLYVPAIDASGPQLSTDV